MTIIDESECKVFCNNCQKTVNNVKSNFSISENFCYHLIGKQTGMLLYTSNNLDALQNQLSKYSESIRDNYTIVRCDGGKL